MSLTSRWRLPLWADPMLVSSARMRGLHRRLVCGVLPGLEASQVHLVSAKSSYRDLAYLKPGLEDVLCRVDDSEAQGKQPCYCHTIRHDA